MTVKKDSWLFKISILSLSTLLMLAPAIASALPLMYEAFPSQGKAAVEMLLTVPNFGIIAALFLSPLLIKAIGEKKTIMLGLIIALACGILPMFSTNYSLIFFARFMFGAGIGLFNSLAVSLLSRFYEGEQLSTMMGFQSMVGSLGAALVAFAVSYLVTIGWQATFAIYLLVLPAMILFGLFVPLENKKQAQAKTESAPKQTVNAGVWGMALMVFFVFAFYMAIAIKLPEFAVTKGIATMSDVSIVSGLSTLVGIPLGLVFGKVHKLLQRKVLLVGFLFAAAGFMIAALATNLFMLGTGVICCGIGLGLALPFIYLTLAQIAPKSSVNLAYTIILITTNIGVFCSPLLFNILGNLLGGASAQMSLFISSFGFMILAGISLLGLLKNKVAQPATQIRK